MAVVPLKETLIAKLMASKGIHTPEQAEGGSDWLRLLLDETIENDQPLWRDPSGFFRVSSAGDPCTRSLTFNAMGHNVPFEARMLRLFRVGNKIEDANVPVFFDAGILIHPQPGEPQEEVVYYNDSDQLLVGHYDLLIKRRGTDELWLGEVKSINERNFKKLGPEAVLPRDNVSNLFRSHPKYVVQWTMYAGSEQVNTPHGFLLFENKNDSAQKIYRLVVDEGIKAAVLEKLVGIHDYVRDVKAQSLAPVPIGRTPGDPRDPVCKWCDHAYLCKRLPTEAVPYDQVRELDAKLRG